MWSPGSRAPTAPVLTRPSAEKALRRTSGREKRAAERKEQRAVKSAANKERQKNRQRSGKWAAEKKAEMVAKKAAKSHDPVKQERKRLRLLTRHNKLKAQAAKISASADEALAMYKRMTEAKEVRGGGDAQHTVPPWPGGRLGRVETNAVGSGLRRRPRPASTSTTLSLTMATVPPRRRATATTTAVPRLECLQTRWCSNAAGRATRLLRAAPPLQPRLDWRRGTRM